MRYTCNDIMDRILRINYFLPKEQELTAMLRERKFSPMPVAVQRYADFVTGNMDQFLKYLRVNNVKGVMFSYSYYTTNEVEELFKLEDRDKTLFWGAHKMETEYYQIFPGGPYSKRERQPTHSGYTSYLAYSKFVRERLDLEHPKELRLYALIQGRVVACQLADAWVMRLDLLDRMSLRRYAMENNLGAGDLHFEFIG